ncbi:MAG: hypothetical protein RLZZ320_262 [Actinomycetota bacterium]
MGGVNGGAELKTISQRGAITSIDGEDGLGHWQVWRAAELGVEKAKEFGISLVSVKNSSHCGALGVYLYPALDAGQISMIFTNGPAVMPAVGRGKIANAAKAGGSIPEGWAVNAKGEPITDAKEALMGMLAPLGGAKGFAEVPDMFNPDDDTKPQGISHTVITIDPNDLGDSASYEDFNKLAASITETGGRVPGSKRTHPNHLGSGEITIADAVLKDLNSWSNQLGMGSFA